MNEGGAEHDNVKLRFYESTHRGVHAACNVQQGDQLLFVPHHLLITMDMA